MSNNYPFPKDVKFGKGTVKLTGSDLIIQAPEEGDWPNVVIDPTKKMFSHCYLKPYRSIMFGRWKGGENRVVKFNQVFKTIYILIRTRSIRGQYCLGAVTLAKSNGGFTFALFPSTHLRQFDKPDIDHITAHIDFHGDIFDVDPHAIVREPNEMYSRIEAPLENLRHTDHTFLFEYWVKKIKYLDPAGKVSTKDPLKWKDRQEMKSLRGYMGNPSNTEIQTITCPSMMDGGYFNEYSPLIMRVGLTSKEEEIFNYNHVTEKPLSPYAERRVQGHSLGLFSIPEISKFHNQWPSNVCLLIELGILKFSPDDDYSIPDLRGSTYNRLFNIKKNIEINSV